MATDKDFDKAFNTILVHEGGYVNHPADKGGPTNLGITQATLSSWLGRPATIDDVKNLSTATAKAIYKARFWDAVKAPQITRASHALVMFDQAVNRGIANAVKQAQRALGITVDGVIGPQTLAAINASQEQTFVDKFLAEAVKSYNAIVAANPTQAVFLKGWLNRVEKLRAEASALFDKVTQAISTAVKENKKPILGVTLAAALGLLVYMMMSKQSRRA